MSVKAFSGNPSVAVVGGGFRDARVTSDSTALLIIDMQYFDASRTAGLGAKAQADGLASEVDYYFTRLEEVTVPAIRSLQDACRGADLPVVHVRIMHQEKNGEDRSMRYKEFGILVAPGSRESEIIDELAPLPGELIVNKTTSSAFVGTNIDSVLRNMGVDTLIVVGVVTHNCVESSVRGAADSGFKVVLVEDGCAAWTEEGHRNSLDQLDHNYGVVKSCADVLAEIEALAS